MTPSRSQIFLFAQEPGGQRQRRAGAGADQHGTQGARWRSKEPPRADARQRARPAGWGRMAMPAPAPASISSLIYEPAVALSAMRR